MTTATVDSSPSPSLARLLGSADTTQTQLTAHLDALAPEARVAECRSLTGLLQRRLWQLCAGAPALTLDDLVPPSTPEGNTVVWAGKNSLLAFTWFEKRFARVGSAVIGYNHQTFSWFTGPGYFTVVQSPHESRELLIDYTQVPAAPPPGSDWPPVKPNESGFSRFVYKDMHDFCRRVARDVIIGSASRRGKDLNATFVLARA